MELHSIIRHVCSLAAPACLALAYGSAGYWPVLIAILSMLLLWLMLRKRSPFWAASVVLSVYLLLCALGILLKSPLLPLVVGCIAALIWWDLMDFRWTLTAEAPPGTQPLLERHRLRSLSMMVSVSLLVEGVGVWLRLHLPFGAILLLILLTTGGLVYTVGIFRNVPTARR